MYVRVCMPLMSLVVMQAQQVLQRCGCSAQRAFRLLLTALGDAVPAKHMPASTSQHNTIHTEGTSARVAWMHGGRRVAVAALAATDPHSVAVGSRTEPRCRMH